LGVGGRSCLSTRHSETSHPVGGMRYSLGAEPKAASGGGLKLPAFSPSFFRQLLIFFSVLESCRVLESLESLVSNHDSCQLRIEEQRSMVQFHLISAMAGRDRRLRRRQTVTSLTRVTEWHETLARVTDERCSSERTIFLVFAPTSAIGNCEDCSG